MKSLSIFLVAIIATSITFSQPVKINPGAGDTHPIATVLGDTLIGSQSKQITALIFKSLMDRFAQENKLEPTPGEIDTFILKMNEKRRQSLGEMDEQITRLRESLKSDSITADDREEAENSIKNVEKVRANLIDIEKKRDEGNPETLKEELESAKHFVRGWKLNSALHKKYGGRVIFQQMGPDPLDAFRDFLRDQEKKGAFSIIDTSHTASFWNYFVNESMHQFYPEDEGARLMTTPWWTMEVPAKK